MDDVLVRQGGQMKYTTDKSLGFTVYRTSLAFKKEFARRLRSYGVTPEQWAVLNCLGEQDGVSQKELAERTYKDSPTTARIIDKLESKGLLKRVDAPQDRRVFLICLTQSGKVLREDILPIATQLNVEASKGLSETDLNQLLDLLNKVYANF
nr:MarR family transcriptional regulator [uncultured Desulfuromonas sp.]